MSDNQKMALINIPEDVLRVLLHLPDDIEIVGLGSPMDHHNVLQVKVRGAGYQTSVFWEQLTKTWADIEMDRNTGTSRLNLNLPGVEPVILNG